MCNLLSSPNSLQYISNTNIYLDNLHVIPKIGHSPNSVPEGHKETLQITFFPQVLACYIQYKDIYSTDT